MDVTEEENSDAWCNRLKTRCNIDGDCVDPDAGLLGLVDGGPPGLGAPCETGGDACAQAYCWPSPDLQGSQLNGICMPLCANAAANRSQILEN